MTNKSNDAIQDWIATGLKSVIAAMVALSVFVFNNLNKNVETSFAALNESIKGLTSQLKIMENHQVETDKRVAAIEVSREIKTANFDKFVQDMGELKQNVMQLTMRVQTMADFMASSFTKKK